MQPESQFSFGTSSVPPRASRPMTFEQRKELERRRRMVRQFTDSKVVQGYRNEVQQARTLKDSGYDAESTASDETARGRRAAGVRRAIRQPTAPSNQTRHQDFNATQAASPERRTGSGQVSGASTSQSTSESYGGHHFVEPPSRYHS